MRPHICGVWCEGHASSGSGVWCEGRASSGSGVCHCPMRERVGRSEHAERARGARRMARRTGDRLNRRGVTSGLWCWWLQKQYAERYSRGVARRGAQPAARE